jgi:DNA-directed RNA polymerase subunit N (RpoN/RPB10)
MSLYDNPMLECSSCGTHLGHLYEDYHALSARLTKDLQSGSLGQYVTRADDDLTEFISTYYKWYGSVDKSLYPKHEPGNIVARALLRTRKLKEEHLPFGSTTEPDGQISVHETRICCLRMLQTDPMMTKIY